jgi:hypothetical protein
MLAFVLLLAAIALPAKPDHYVTDHRGEAAAFAFHFSSHRDGALPQNKSARVLVQGSQWRVDFDADPREPAVETAIIGTGKEVIAINDQNRTWFRSRTSSPAIESRLFSFGTSTQASKIAVNLDRPQRLTFSYQLKSSIGPMSVAGDVRGESVMSPCDPPPLGELPWSPVEFATGIASVDDALRRAVAGIGTPICRAETTVSRRIERGNVLAETIISAIDSFRPATASAAAFEVPAGYRYQEPLIGAPGRDRAQNP